MGCVGGSLLYFIKGKTWLSYPIKFLKNFQLLNGEFRCLECPSKTEDILGLLSCEKQSSFVGRKFWSLGRHVLFNRMHANLLQVKRRWQKRCSSRIYYWWSTSYQRRRGSSFQAGNDRWIYSYDHRNSRQCHGCYHVKKTNGVLAGNDETRASSHETNGTTRR